MWLDPGKLTGWAMLESTMMFSSGQGDFDETDDLVNTWARTMRADLWLGWEMYVVTQGGGRSGTPSFSLEVIGAVKSACRRHGVTVLKPVPSSSRMLGDESKLRRLGWWRPGARHANDAAMHLTAFLLRERLMPAEMSSKLFTPG